MIILSIFLILSILMRWRHLKNERITIFGTSVTWFACFNYELLLNNTTIDI